MVAALVDLVPILPDRHTRAPDGSPQNHEAHLFCVFSVLKVDEAEASGTAGLLVVDDADVCQRAVLGEDVSEVALRRVQAQTEDAQATVGVRVRLQCNQSLQINCSTNVDHPFILSTATLWVIIIIIIGVFNGTDVETYSNRSTKKLLLCSVIKLVPQISGRTHVFQTWFNIKACLRQVNCHIGLVNLATHLPNWASRNNN